MADTVDSLSIELTANTESAEQSIDKLIGKLNQLKSAVSGASNFNKVAQGIAQIAAVASGIDSDAGKKLAHLAAGITALSKVGDLSNLNGAGKVISSVVSAVNGQTSGGKGLSNLAEGIRQANNALGGIKNADVSKLGEIRDALSGEMSGSLHQANRNVIEHPALGGSVAQNYDLGLVNPAGVSIYEKIAYALNDATAAHREFAGEVRGSGGIAGLLGSAVGGAMTVFTFVADSIRDAANAYGEFARQITGQSEVIETEFVDVEQTSENVSARISRIIDRLKREQENLRNLRNDVINVPPTDYGYARNGTINGRPMGFGLPESGSFFGFARNAGEVESRLKGVAYASWGANNGLTNLASIFRRLGMPITSAIDGIKKFENAIGGGLFTALAKAGNGILGFFRNIVRIAKYRAIRAMLKDMTQSFKDLYGWSKAYGTQFYKSMDTINTSFVYLRNSIAAMVAPLINALAPALDYVIDKVVVVLNWFNQLFAALSGAETYTVAKKVAQSWGSTFDKASSNAKKATDELKRTILGFDEINKLNDNSDKSSGSGSGSSPYSDNYKYMFEELPLTGGFKGFSDAIENAVSDTLSRIAGIVSLVPLAVGAILTFSGANVPLGLGLMVAGAAGLGSVVIANWNGISDKIKLVAGLIEGALAGGLAVGAILAFSSGNIPLGIGLMAGAITTGFGAVDIVWTTLKDKVGGQLAAILGLVGTGLTGIGLVMMLAGPATFGLGLAVMAAGIGMTAGVVNFAFVPDKLKGIIGTITGIVSAGLLGIGAVLAFSAVAVPLGIALMALGAAGLASTVVLNWNYIVDALKGPLGEVVAAISSALLFLGIIALVAGAIPLGVGLLLAGSTGLAGTIAANWDNLKDFGKKAFENVKKGWDSLAKKALEIKAAIVTKAQELWDGLKKGWDDLKNKVVEFAANVKDDAVQWWKNVKNYWAAKATIVGEFLTNVKDNSIGWWRNVKEWWSGKVGAVESFATNVKNTATSWWNNVKIWWGAKVGSVEEFATNVKDTAAAWWSRVQKLWDKEIKGKSVSEIITNIKDRAADWWSDVQKYWDQYIQQIGGFLGITIKPKVKLSAETQEIMEALNSGDQGKIDAIYSKYGPDRVLQGVSEDEYARSTSRSGLWGLIQDIFDPVAYAEDDGGAMAKAQATQTANAFKTMFDGTNNNTKIVGRVGGNIVGSATKLTKALNENTNATKVDSNGYLPYTFGTATQAEFNSAWGEFVGDGFNVNATVDFSPKDSTVGAYKNRGLLGYLKEIFAPGTDTQTRVTLVKHLWDTVYGFVNQFSGGNVGKFVDLISNFGSTVLGWVNGRSGGNAQKWVDLISNFGGSVLDWINNGRSGGNAQKWVDLISNFGGSVLDWVNGRSGGDVGKFVTLLALGWTTVKDFVEGKGPTNAESRVSLIQNWVGTFIKWLTGNDYGEVTSTVYREKGFFDTFVEFLTGTKSGDVTSYVYRTAGWVGTFLKFLTGSDSGSVTSKVSLTNSGTNWSKGIVDFITAGAGVVKLIVDLVAGTVSGGKKAAGGVYQNGKWSDIPQYAGGTTNAHGSLFLAGEAGPEIVGHVGGRTEVLNKSQLAATMYAAVHSAMQGVRIDAMFYDGSTGGGDGTDYDTMYRAMYDAFTAAMARGDERDVEKVALLRRISEKDFTTNVSTADINRSQRYMNRRAGVTVVPVNG